MSKSVECFPMVECRMVKSNVHLQRVRFDKLMKTVNFYQIGRIYLHKNFKNNSGYSFLVKYLDHHGIRANMYHSGYTRTTYLELLQLKATSVFLENILG